MTAEASGLGAGRFEGYKLGYTGGSDLNADKIAIEGAATQPEVVSLSRIKKKLAVASEGPQHPNSTYRIHIQKRCVQTQVR
jgi:hypothetical protein